MKALICVLGLWVTIAWTHEFDWSTLQPDVPSSGGLILSTIRQAPQPPSVPLGPDVHHAHGFDGFPFGASKDYVRDGREAQGRTLHHEDPDWLWYGGWINGCDVGVGYRFKDELLYSGLWRIENTDTCFDVIQTRLIEYYSDDFTMKVTGTTVRTVFEIRYTKIIHEINDRWHGVSFYNTTPGSR